MDWETGKMNLISAILAVVFIAAIIAGSVFLKLHDVNNVGYI